MGSDTYSDRAGVIDHDYHIGKDLEAGFDINTLC